MDRNDQPFALFDETELHLDAPAPRIVLGDLCAQYVAHGSTNRHERLIVVALHLDLAPRRGQRILPRRDLEPQPRDKSPRQSLHEGMLWTRRRLAPGTRRSVRSSRDDL